MPLPTCYVCGGPIRGKALYISKGLYRHPSRCGPGSQRYMQDPALAALYNSLMGRGGSTMKKADVKVGGVYAAKVSDKIVPVRIDRTHSSGGWVGTNQDSGREVRIKSAQRLRGPWPTAHEPTGGAQGEEETQGKPKRAKGKTRAPRAPKGGDGALSGLDAAAKVLEEAGEPLSCQVIVERALAKGYWKTGGKTPAATVYAAIIREIAKKGDAARFRKAGRGRFELAG